MEAASDRSDAAGDGAGAAAEATTGTIIPFPTPDASLLAAGTLPWDQDAHTAAWQQADAMAGRDAEAAVYLQMAALAAAAPPLQPEEEEQAEEEEEDWLADDLPADGALWQPLEAPAGPEPFDVMRFFDALSAEYGWTPMQIKEAPWKTLLGYAREAELRHQREQQAIEDARRGQGQEVVPAGMEEAHLRNYLPAQPIPWETEDSF